MATYTILGQLVLGTYYPTYVYYTANGTVYLGQYNFTSVAVGHYRLTPVGNYAANSIVASGDSDVGTPFVSSSGNNNRLWTAIDDAGNKVVYFYNTTGTHLSTTTVAVNMVRITPVVKGGVTLPVGLVLTGNADIGMTITCYTIGEIGNIDSGVPTFFLTGGDISSGGPIISDGDLQFFTWKPVKVKRLEPTGPGTLFDYTKLDDYPPTTTDYWSGTVGVDTKGTVQSVMATPLPTSTIKGVTICMDEKSSDASYAKRKLYIIHNGTEYYEPQSQIYASEFLHGWYYFTKCPWTGQPWTWNDLANIYIGALVGTTGPGVTIWVYDLWIEVYYEPKDQVTVDTLGLVRDADMRHVIQSAVARVPPNGALQSVRFQIANDSAGTSVIVDSQTQAETAVDGQTLSWIHTWTPSSSGTYWLRVGVVCEDHPTVLWAVSLISISIPTITSCSVVQQGEYLYAEATLSNPTLASGMMFYAGGDGAPMERDGSVMKAHLWVEVGDIAWSVVITTPWANLMRQGTIHVSYTPQIGIHIYNGDKELNAKDISLTEALIPEVPQCTFTTADTVLPTDIITIKTSGKRWRMIINSINSNSDGSYTINCKDRGAAALTQEVTLSELPTLSWGIALQLNLRWAADYAGLLNAIITDAQWENTPVNDILQQLALLNNVSFLMRDGALYVLTQDKEPVFAVSKGKQQDCSQIKNHIREEYTIADYPSPASLLTTLPAAWTGTVVAADYVPATRLYPPSKAVSWLHATGEIYTTQVGATISDYDRVHGYWTPAASGNLTIKLEQDANNYLTKTIPYAGTMATGWLATADSSQSIAAHTYSMSGRYAGIRLKFDQPCTVRVREIKNNLDVYVTPWREVGTEEVTISLNYSQTEDVDSIVVEVTNLHIIDTVYGIRCTSATLYFWTTTMVAIGTTSSIAWQAQAVFYPGTPDSPGALLNTHPPVQAGDVYHYTITPNPDGSIYFYAYLERPHPAMVQQFTIISINVTESAPLFQELDIALGDFVKTGNPITLSKITLTATGDNYYDAICLVNTRKTRKAIDVYTDDWTSSNDRLWRRNIDQWRNPDVARAFASALLNIYSKPLTQYTETVGWNAPVNLGDIVTTPDGNLIVNAIIWDSQTGTKTLRVGQRIKDTLAWMQQVNQSLIDLKRMV